MGDSPLASAGGGINDSLALLNFTETRSIHQEQLIISGRVQTAEVDILVALNPVLEALVESLALLGSSEDGRNSGRNLGILLDEGTKLSLSDLLDVSGDWTNHSRDSKLLRGGGSVAGAVSGEDARSIVSVRHSTKEGSTRSGLGSSGRVGSSAVVESGHVSKTTINAITVGVGSARSVGNHVGAVATGNSTLVDVVTSRDAAAVDGIGRLHSHIERSRDTSICVVHDRGISSNEAGGGHGNWSSALVKVIMSQAESAELTDKTSKSVVVGGWVVNATSSNIVRSSIGSHVSRGHAGTRSLVVAVGSHRGRIVVRHDESL